MKKERVFDYSIPIVIIAALAVLGLTGFFERLDGSTYNMLLRLKPRVEEHEDLLLVDFDDASIELAGTWPVSRSIFADGMLLMRELGAEYIVFDIEYVDTSPRGINSRFLNETMPKRFKNEFESIKGNTVGLVQAISEGRIPADEADDFVPDLVTDLDSRLEELLSQIEEVVRNHDVYLGRAAAVFEKAFFTVNIIPDEKPVADERLEQYVFEQVAYPHVTGTLPEDLVRYGMVPTIYPILSRSAGAGFPNVIIDEDGVRRRIHLLYEYDGHYFAQLGFRPLLDWLGNPRITVSDSRIVLQNAVLPGAEEPRRITIPFTPDHTMLINWPAKSFVESFRHLSFGKLIIHDELFDHLIENLEVRADWGYLGAYQGSTPLLDVYAYYTQLRNDMLEAEDPEALVELREVREYLLAEIDGFLNGPAEENLLASLDQNLEAGYLSQDDYELIRNDVPDWFADTRTVLADLQETRAELSEALAGAFCITGHVGTSTTDIGVNPFEGEYMNVGTHASVVNTILQRDFLDEAPGFISIVLALVLCYLMVLAITPMKPLPTIIAGVGFLAITITGQILFFVFTGIYSEMVVPNTAILLSFVTATVVKFLRTERERSYIRDAFSHYLSSDVVKEIISDPDMLKLGGEEREMTAIFTDIRGFSSVSEKMEPNMLVRLLNVYLGDMSDIILEEKGTIDKYEGDAIISFFGAPVELPDHADRACRSAVRMRRMEHDLNERFISEGLSPDRLNTRIGINSGPMVVGNMGTTNKMDYTIMGNSVNLAARLEGVNKFYGTWTIMSEYTRDQTNVDEYLMRTLDRVRVVGIKHPVRLYELLEEKHEAEGDTVEAVELFHDGLALFEQREWEAASKRFEEVLSIVPDDAPAKQFAERCNKFKKTPPSENWDGVFNYSSK